MAKLIVTNPDQTKNKYNDFMSSGSLEDYIGHVSHTYRTTPPVVGDKDVHFRIKVASKRAILDKAANLGITVTPEHHAYIDKQISAAMAHRNKLQKGFKSKFGVIESKDGKANRSV